MSDFSFGEGAVSPERYATHAASTGHAAVALTDRMTLAGTFGHAKACAKSGVSSIPGVLLDVECDGVTGDVLVLTRTASGFALLSAFLDRHLRDLPGRPVPFAVLAVELRDRALDGTVVASGAGANGLVGAMLSRRRAPTAVRALFRDLAERARTDPDAPRPYLEVCRTDHPDAASADAAHAMEADVLAISREDGVPLLATADVRYADDEDHLGWTVSRAVVAASGKRKADAVLEVVDGHIRSDGPVRYGMRSPQAMVATFADLPEAVLNTVLVHYECRHAPSARKPVLPRFSDEGVDEDELLGTLVQRGLAARLDAADLVAPREDYEARARYEVGVIRDMGFSGYFLIVHDFVAWARSNGVPVGPGRGSGAGSVVAWALTITDLDPLRYGLLFERFLNPDRVSMPDFDIDFCPDRRDEVIDYVRGRYGAERVAGISAFGTAASKRALDDAARVLSFDGRPINGLKVSELKSAIPRKDESPEPRPLAEAKQMSRRFAKIVDSDDRMRTLLEVARSIEGRMRDMSTHPAGVAIAPGAVTDMVPVCRSPDTGHAVSMFDMKGTESSGLVKFDFLSLKSLTIIRTALRLVRETEGEEIDIGAIDLDDPETLAMLARGDGEGIFQLESEGIRAALRQIEPKSFTDVVAVLALFRPGPMANIPLYAARNKGAPYEHIEPAALTGPILRETNGIIVYQEQVMQIARTVAGYSLGQADLLRRAMGKKIKAEMDAQRETFVSGCLEHGGLDRRKAEELFATVEKFASYGFNKSHAAAYGVVSMQTAWLRRHKPAAFWAAMFTHDPAKERKQVWRDAMRRDGVDMLPPCVNASAAGCTVETHKGRLAVRLGLCSIGGVSNVDAFLEARGGVPFTSPEEMVDRTRGKLNSYAASVASLARVGALDRLSGHHRGRIQATVAHLASSTAGGGLFGDLSYPDAVVRAPDLPSYPDAEFKACGFYFGDHPLDRYIAMAKDAGVTTLADARDMADKENLEEVPVRLLVMVKEFTADPGRYGWKVRMVVQERGEGYTAMSFPDGEEAVERLTANLRVVRDERIPVILHGSVVRDGERGFRVTVRAVQRAFKHLTVEGGRLVRTIEIDARACAGGDTVGMDLAELDARATEMGEAAALKAVRTLLMEPMRRTMAEIHAAVVSSGDTPKVDVDVNLRWAIGPFVDVIRATIPCDADADGQPAFEPEDVMSVTGVARVVEQFEPAPARAEATAA